MLWQPTASFANLKKRAMLIAKIRNFFAERNVLEVDTPSLSPTAVTDPHIVSIPAIYKAAGSSKEKITYLHTSPEYAMKRLLAAGSGSIYQICKAYRQGDLGSIHNPEFTMLEWYRVGYDHHALMNEMDSLLQSILQCQAAERVSYAKLFEKYVGVNPHIATVEELKACVQQHPILFEGELTERDAWLSLLLIHCIEPQIGKERPIFIYDFPVSQAALAKIRYEENPPVASRFEVYFKGVELANGFHELQDVKEQRKRFENDLLFRANANLPVVPVDECFLAALEHGLPDCAGVALGVDRLIMLALECSSLKEVLSFDFERV